jgi:hypothetical protein
MSLACSTYTVLADSKLSFEEAGIPAKDPNMPPARGSPDIDWLLTLFQKHGTEIAFAVKQVDYQFTAELP